MGGGIVILLALIILAVVVVLGVVGYLAGWWLRPEMEEGDTGMRGGRARTARPEHHRVSNEGNERQV